jgi:hypothetical protein
LTGWFLAFLVGASLAISIPAGLRARRSSPFPAARLYKKRMSMMAPRSRGGRWVVVPDGDAAVQARLIARRARRRQIRILMVLVVVALATGIWAVFTQGVAVPINLTVDVMAFTYGAVVFEARRRQAEQRRKVRSMARHPLSSSRGGWPDIDHESIAL